VTSISQRHLGRRLIAQVVATGVRVRESSLWSDIENVVPFEEISESVTRVGFRSKRWGVAAAVCLTLTALMAVVALAGGDSDGVEAVAFYGVAALFCSASFVLSSRRYDRYGELILFAAPAADERVEAFLTTVFERRRAFLRDKYLTMFATAAHPRSQIAAELRALGVFDESEIEVLAAKLSRPSEGGADGEGPGNRGGGSRLPN
jgi:hypothetical protein